MMRDQVLGLEAVSANGAVVGGLNKMIKNNSGYDLRHLPIGNEGTLAVITRVVLRLRPEPTATATAWCGRPDFESVTTLLTRAQAGLAPGVSAFEVMWAGYYDAVLRNLANLRAPLGEPHPFYVLLESVGTDPVRHGDAFEEFLGSMLEEGILSDAAIASSDAHAQAFGAIRDAPGEYQRFIPNHAAYDVSFSIAQVGEATAQCEARLRERWPDAAILVYGHLGDGNIRIFVDVPGPGKHDHDDIDRVICDVTGDFGGSISAQHGIRVKKKEYLHLSRTESDIESMRAFKQALDPLGILNPGKVFLGDSALNLLLASFVVSSASVPDKRVALRVAIACLITFAGVAVFQNHLLYFPEKAPVDEMISGGLRAWPSPQDFRGLVAEPDEPARATAIVFHGNGGHAGHRQFYATALTRLGLRVILAEYRGYGPRGGSLGEKSLVADAEETIALAHRLHGTPVLLIGESLGSGVAAAAGARQRDRTAGMLLITPWDRLENVAAYHYPWLPVKWLLQDHYDSASHLASYGKPVFVVIAERDSIVPPRFGTALYDALPQPKKLTVVQAAGHNDWAVHVGEDWWRDAITFVLAGSDGARGRTGPPGS